MDINVILFEGFEPLDVIGPLEVLGDIEEYRLRYFSQEGGLISCRQQLQIQTEPFASLNSTGILLVPGGAGSRTLIHETAWLSTLANLAQSAPFVLSICTDAALLAKSHALDGRQATSNKRAWDWVLKSSDNVHWQACARWVVDGKFYSASGVSAGIDMTLGFVADQWGRDRALKIAHRMEYSWNDDPNIDPFATELNEPSSEKKVKKHP